MRSELAVAQEPEPVAEGRHLSSKRGLLRAVCGALAGFLAVNLFVGVAVFRSPGRRYDAIWGDVQTPGVYVAGTEGYTFTTINSIGMRAPEPSALPARARRILFVGDSFTEAFQVPDGRTFVDLVGASLREQGEDVVTVNAGRSGGNSAMYLELADRYLATYRPDRVVLQLGEDDFTTEKGQAYWFKPQSSSWVIERTAIGSSRDSLRNIVTKVPVAYYLWQRAKRAAADEGESADKPWQHPDDRLIGWIADRIRERYGADVVVFYLPKVDYLGDLEGVKPMEDAVRRAFEGRGITFVDMRGPFADEYRRTGQPAHGFENTQPGRGHLNERGHKVVAETLAPLLSGNLSATSAVTR